MEFSLQRCSDGWNPRDLSATERFSRLRMLLLVVLLASCPVLVRGAEDAREPRHLRPDAEVVFATKQIRLGGKRLTVEMADTDERRARGLMYRTQLAPNSGMLFVFPQEEILTFWMRNTLIPLSIGFFDRDRRYIGSAEMVPAPLGSLSPPITSSPGPARYALEMPAGWFQRNRLKPGARFDFISK